jgi:hypothetical protein
MKTLLLVIAILTMGACKTIPAKSPSERNTQGKH